MVQKILHIPSDNAHATRLLIEIGQQQLACWTLDEDTESLSGFELFAWNENSDLEKEWENILQQSSLLANDGSDNAVTLIWQTLQEKWIPQSFANNIPATIASGSAFATAFCTTEAYTLRDDSLELFEISTVHQQLILSRFPTAKSISKQGSIRKVLQSQAELDTTRIYVLYQHQYCYIAAIDKGNILFIQQFGYQSSLDPVYHILHNAALHQLPMESTTVFVSGLIDQDSSLYADLYRFIPHLRFDAVTKNLFDTEKHAAHPAHYFVPFIKYAI